MTDRRPPPHPSRFAEDPGWITPERWRSDTLALVEHAVSDDERSALASAADRLSFTYCTPQEQAVIRRLNARAGL